MYDDSLIAFVRDSHNGSCSEFSKFPEHCLRNSWESEVIPELSKYQCGELEFQKNSRSLMFGTGFISSLSKMKLLREVVITGCCTDLCVLDLALPLVNYFDAYNRNVDVIVPMDSVETFEAPNHTRDEFNSISFKLMEQEGVKLVKNYGGRL